MNEFKQESEAAVKSVLFGLRKHRWERIYIMFQQRSSCYHYYTVIMLLSCLHGICDSVDLHLIRVFEYIGLTIDISYVCNLSISSYFSIYN